MGQWLIRIGVPLLAAVMGAMAVVLWLGGSAGFDLERRDPGRDRPGGAQADARPPIVWPDQAEPLDGQAADLPGDWPQFRGAQGDGVCGEDAPRLARQWPDAGPPVLWAIDVGEGYAGTAVRSGRVYLIDYDAEAQADSVRCLSLADGKDIWRYRYPVKVKRNHGMSRTVPTVTDKYVVTIGPKCHVLCLDATTGEHVWHLDLVDDYGTTVPPWYAGQCPLVDGDRVILAPGGPDVLMTAVDIATGQVIWTTPNRPGWKMTHASIVPIELAGKRMYVYCASGGVVGVSAEDGELLWQTNAWKISIATIATPVPVGNDQIFFSGGYNAGSAMLRLRLAGEQIETEEVFRLKPEVFGATQQTPILYNGYIYGIRPSGEMVCLDLMGREIWTSGEDHRFGLGPYTLSSQGLIYAMDDDGVLSLMAAAPGGFKLLGRADVLDGHDSWGPMALAGGRLIVRDLTRMVCLDVAER